MTRVFYATHSNGAYNEGVVVLLDDAVPEEWGLINSGYFKQIVTPEASDAVEDPNRAG